MEKVSKFQILKFFFFLTIFAFFTIIFWARFGFKIGIQSVFLSWSFLVLCIPAAHGKIMLGVPFKFITGKNFLYSEIFMWLAAIFFNMFTYITTPWIYFATFTNHLLLRIISTPWPYWVIIFICALGTFYKFLIGVHNFDAKKIRHYLARTALITFALVILFYLSYKEVVILLNIRA